MHFQKIKATSLIFVWISRKRKTSRVFLSRKLIILRFGMLDFVPQRKEKDYNWVISPVYYLNGMMKFVGESGWNWKTVVKISK